MYPESLLKILLFCMILLVSITNHQQLDTQQLIVTFTKHDRNKNKVLQETETKSLIKQVLGEYMQHTQGKNSEFDDEYLIESIRKESNMYDRKGDGLDFKEYVRFIKSMVDTEL